VHFTSSCNPGAQQELDQAVALRHSFEFRNAISGFNAALVKDPAYWALQAQIEEAEVRAWAMLAEARKDQALQTMQSATGLDDGTEKGAITPGPLAPAHELYGEMLLQVDQPAPALVQFESTLKKEPGRLRSLYGAGRAARLPGHSDLSRTYFRELLRICEHGDEPGRKALLEAKDAVALQ
jgi:tetratricopeptide (TPR) repeat protein